MKTLVAVEGIAQTIDAAEPMLKEQHVLVETVYSAISAGTEMTLQKNAGAEPLALGYSAAGIVREVGAGVSHVHVGQRVACYGAPFVKHAEYLVVPKHLITPIPDHVDLREAAFVGLGAIAIHALRQSHMQFGEKVVVVGLGILGNIICQIANAAAYHTFGIDLLPERCTKLKELGIEEAYCSTKELEAAIGKEGADTVIICAGGHAPGLIDSALGWLRDRGKIIIVGDIKPEFDREAMFSKEAEVLISRAGGPGRYDHQYEVNGHDYPIGYVRWTEGRNVAEFIRLLERDLVQIEPLISSVFPIDRASEAYELLASAPEKTIGVLVDFKSA
ncbi:zinc-dependent alcohol dehydrogenase [Paenibacillus marinisediminis]